MRRLLGLGAPLGRGETVPEVVLGGERAERRARRRAADGGDVVPRRRRSGGPGRR